MANLYGVANPNPPPNFNNTIGSADIVIPVGPETNFVSGTAQPIVAPGWYYAAAFGAVTFLNGATPPSFLNFALRIGAGADIATISTQPTWLTASINQVFPIFLYAPLTVIANPAAATILNVSATVGAQSITVRQFGTYIYLQWVRAPDQ